MTKVTIGVDISKDSFDPYRLNAGRHARFDTTPAGFRAFLHWLGRETPALVVYEATSAYHCAF